MTVQGKIYINIFMWAVITGLCYFTVFPALANSLTAIQASHQKQQDQLARLNAQITSLRDMQSDLKSLQAQTVQPDNYFTSDIQLVKEIQHLEDIAKATNLKLVLMISGTADQAAAYPSKSLLYQVPYTINVSGTYPEVVTFLKYLENSYFVSPVQSISMDVNSGTGAGEMTASILAKFFIHR